MTDAGPAPTVSVLVPALNEGPVVRAHLGRIVAALEALRRPFEVVLVDDGSTDATAAEAEAAAREDPRVRVVRHPRNRGKGAALATGCAAARGATLVFLDADLDIAPEEVGPLLARLEATGADVAVGSKWAPGARERRPLHRTLLSRLYLAVTSVLFRLPIRDTQTGLKALRRPVAAAVVPRLVTRRFAWDVELLVLAHRAGARIVAAPVTVDFRRPGVRIGALGFLRSGLDTLAVFLRLRGLAAYGPRPGARRPRGPRTTVVLSGDDLGLAPSVDRGLLDAARAGRLTAVSYLATGPTARTAGPAAAAARRDAAGGFDVGLHVDPVAATGAGSALRFGLRALLGLVPAAAVRAAVADAAARARAAGLAPTHLDAHRHAFLWPAVMRGFAQAARAEGLAVLRRPVPLGAWRVGPGPAGRLKALVLAVAGLGTRGVARAAGLVSPDGLLDVAEAARRLARGRRLPRGVVEVVAHPAAGPDDVPPAERGPDRAADAAALAGLRAACEAHGVAVVRMSDLPALRRRGSLSRGGPA